MGMDDYRSHWGEACQLKSDTEHIASFSTSRDMIKQALKEEDRDVFMNLVKRLADIENRDERILIFDDAVKKLSFTARHLLNLINNKELEHVMFVNKVLPHIPEFPKEERKPHDFSKDPLYFFVTSLKFDCAIKSDELNRLASSEIQRHYVLESHHPEWESQHQRECTAVDILEMAVDRLCRNVQVNNGSIDMDQMIAYLPQFPLGDNLRKQTIYLEMVERYKETVKGCYIPYVRQNN